MTNRGSDPKLPEELERLMARLRELDATLDPARQQRIEEIKRQIEDGTYHVPAEDIAEKILRDALLNRRIRDAAPNN
jgi:flagellar biosynthesis anti-sigma factor FlgM